VRLGRDGDIEEWLATDTALDRPVLIRALDPTADENRRLTFAADVRAAAAVSHIHLARVYEVNANSGVFAVLEWNGGVSIADRLRAGDTLPVNEFLPNAAGLADGLSALHDSGVVHGAIDPAAIHFSAAHPAKLTAFGRPHPPIEQGADTAALAMSLRQALTGSPSRDLRASQVVEGLPRSVDDALDGAEDGHLSAGQLAVALRSAPYRPETSSDSGWSWGWVVPAVVLVIAAAVIAGLGLTIDVDPDSPFLFPATPQSPRPTTTTAPVVDGGTTAPIAPPPDGVVDASATSFDPLGDNGTEREGDIPLINDGSTATAWRTERYFSPLPSLKPGVGVVFDPVSDVRIMSIIGSPGTQYEIGWSETPPVDIGEWETISSGTLVGGSATLQLPGRSGGVWLLWLTSLPEQVAGEFYSEIAEVTFGP
jgi:serine/threonine protein kinase